MRSRISRLSFLLGVVVILGGFIVSIAMRNPGGPPVSARDAQAATRVAYMAFGIGAAIAVLGPCGLAALPAHTETE
ncbi:MAG: hypothetical protein AAFX06_31160, partial [Planctomycetota bacterium]